MGVVLGEDLNYIVTAENLVKMGGRSLGASIAKITSNKEIGYDTYDTPYESGACPVLNFASGI